VTPGGVLVLRQAAGSHLPVAAVAGRQQAGAQAKPMWLWQRGVVMCCQVLVSV
jgi:hypothetical protein